ncbi:MAG: gliding motility-associated C-terminal domain-containing protein [bacterium]|nr:gliding motility-associated C-terminal domain-containing protein [bacterium]
MLAGNSLIRAKRVGQNITSSSNISCLGTFSIIEPSNSYIGKISVEKENVEMALVTQIGTSLTKLNIYKSEDNNPFSLWQTINFTGGTLNLVDNQVKVHSKNYSYYFTTEGNCTGLIFDSSQICKTILLKVNMQSLGNQDLAWNNYSLFKKNTEKQEILLINTPNANKSSPWNIVNSLTPSIVVVEDKNVFSTSMQQLCYCVRAVENPINQFYRRQDTSYSNIECVTADPIVFFPNAIQINGFNTVFFPEGIFLDYEKSSFQIFNRWGQLLYETNDIKKGWDGKLENGEYVEEDIYAYRASIIGINGKQLTFDGTITVLK